MAVVIATAGLLIGVATESWIPFGVAVVIAFGWVFIHMDFLHNHMHKLYEGEEDEHGVKTID